MGDHANLVIHTKQPADVEVKIFTSTNQEVMTIRRNYPSPGRQAEKVYVGNLANGVYLVMVKAKGGGVEERVVYKMAILK